VLDFTGLAKVLNNLFLKILKILLKKIMKIFEKKQNFYKFLINFMLCLIKPCK